MNQLFGSFFGRTPGLLRPAAFPALNVSEDDDNLYIRAELPGIDSESIEISVEGETLTLRGERKSKEPSGNISYHRRERETGRFRRVISFPTRINAEKVEANFKNGVLKVVLPKAEEAKPRQITIQGE
jgi:HSP20 family protein